MLLAPIVSGGCLGLALGWVFICTFAPGPYCPASYAQQAAPPQCVVGGEASSRWTLDTLYVHLLAIINDNDKRYEQRFSAQDTSVQAALASAQQAVNKAEFAAEKRFDSVNEFRKTLGDQATTFFPRNEALGLIKAQSEKLDGLSARLDRIEGHSSGSDATWSAFLAVGALLVAAVGVMASFIALRRSDVIVRREKAP